METYFVHITETSPLMAFRTFADCEASVRISWSRVRGITLHAKCYEANRGDFTIFVRNECGDEIGQAYFRAVQLYTEPAHL
jgi:hypothetical protein